MSEFAPLFTLLREETPPGVWSLGVELNRKAQLVVEKQSPQEIVLTVTTPAKALSATVKIWPADEDWHCDCGRSTYACEHVVASVIALRRAEETGTALSRPAESATVRYAFTSPDDTLRMDRAVGPNIFQGSLHRLKKSGGPAPVPSQADASIDGLVSDLKAGPLSVRVVWETLIHLRGRAHVTLDGVAIGVGRPVKGYRIVVKDTAGGAVEIAAEPAPDVARIFKNGACLSNGELCPIEEVELRSDVKILLERSKLFPSDRIPEVISSWMPELEKHFPVLNLSSRITTGGEAELPRVMVQTSASREILVVLPLLVYGDPPYARVDGSSLTLVGDSGRLPQRNLEAETRAVNTFRAKTGLGVGRRFEFRGDSAISMSEKFSELNLTKVGDGLRLFSPAASLKARIVVGPESFQLAFENGTDGAPADAREVLRAWREGRERVALLNGGWATVPHEWLAKHGHSVLDLLDSRERGAKLDAVAKVELARLCEALDSPCPADFTSLRKTLEEFTRIPKASLPGDLTATLREYQKLGVDWLAFLKVNKLGALLADDMGLGKTIQTLCILKKPSLIVAPTSVLANWKKELNRFRPKLRVHLHHGAGRKLDSAADITLTSYALLRLDADELSDVEWDTVVLDEAQNIKNPQSQSAQAAYGLDGKFRVALSGTPVENRVEDLWSLFHFINPGLLGPLSSFKDRYGSVEASANLRTKVKPFLLRRLKKEVVPELPPRTEIVLDVELEKREKDLYDAVLAAARTDVLEALGRGEGVMAALECLLRLRQAACHSGLLPGQTAKDSSKLQLLRERLEEVVSEGHKALVFSQWTSLLDLLGPTLKAEGLDYYRIDGSTRAEDRMKTVEAFQREGGPQLLLMTLKAGGVGLNLTAADHVFLIDPWWNPAAEDQAADRAHRIGQDKPVFIHRLVSKGTVEEKILLLQNAKRTLAQNALSGTAAAGITREDLMALLID